MHINVQTVNYDVGKGPESVAIEDLNKDGYLDIITANYESNSVSVLFGNPSKTFSPAPNSPYSVGTHPHSVSIADLNGDGYLDIVIANKGANSVSALLGNAAGTFAPSPNSPYPIGIDPRSVAVADLNKDGYLDIVTANFGAHSVSILLGSSDVAFSQSTGSTYSVGTNPSSVAIADLNKDDYLDIVTANYESNSVSVLFGNPAGTFSPAPNSPYFVAKRPHSVAIADLNKDGYLDIVTANAGSNSVSVLLGNSTGTFFQATNSPYAVDTNPVSVAIADLNKDGYLDIITAQHHSHSVSVLLGNSAGTFFLPLNFPYSSATNPRSVKIADLNNDGNLDIVTANWVVNSVSILFGAIDGPFSQSMDQFMDQKLGQVAHKVTHLEQAIKEQKLELVKKDHKLELAMNNITHLEQKIEDLKLEMEMKDQKKNQYDSTLVQLQQQIKAVEHYSIICPFIIASALIIGAEKGPNLLTGAAIGALSGAAACVLMHSYDVMPKLIGDTKPKVHQQPPEEDL